MSSTRGMSEHLMLGWIKLYYVENIVEGFLIISTITFARADGGPRSPTSYAWRVQSSRHRVESVFAKSTSNRSLIWLQLCLWSLFASNYFSILFITNKCPLCHAYCGVLDWVSSATMRRFSQWAGVSSRGLPVSSFNSCHDTHTINIYDTQWKKKH